MLLLTPILLILKQILLLLTKILLFVVPILLLLLPISLTEVYFLGFSWSIKRGDRKHTKREAARVAVRPGIAIAVPPGF